MRCLFLICVIVDELANVLLTHSDCCGHVILTTNFALITGAFADAYTPGTSLEQLYKSRTLQMATKIV